MVSKGKENVIPTGILHSVVYFLSIQYKIFNFYTLVYVKKKLFLDSVDHLPFFLQGVLYL